MGGWAAAGGWVVEGASVSGRWRRYAAAAAEAAAAAAAAAATVLQVQTLPNCWEAWWGCRARDWSRRLGRRLSHVQMKARGCLLRLAAQSQLQIAKRRASCRRHHCRQARHALWARRCGRVLPCIYRSKVDTKQNAVKGTRHTPLSRERRKKGRLQMSRWEGNCQGSQVRSGKVPNAVASNTSSHHINNW